MTLPFGRPESQGGMEVKPPAKDSKVYRAEKDFWFAPFMLLHKGAVIYYSLKEQRVVYMPCGYSPADDVEAGGVKPWEIDDLVRKRWLVDPEEKPRTVWDRLWHLAFSKKD